MSTIYKDFHIATLLHVCNLHINFFNWIMQKKREWMTMLSCSMVNSAEVNWILYQITKATLLNSVW